MANVISFKDKKFGIGDTIEISYKIKEGDKERIQLFKGILIKIKGDSDNNRMITVRKTSKSGIGVERIIPMISPNLVGIELLKKGSVRRAKLYFIRGLTDSEIRYRIYRKKKK
jgi:large subunit ribosomal protein L19